MSGGEGRRAALLVVDMLNPYDHEDADALAGHVAETIETLADLVRRAREAPDDVVDLVYVNDTCTTTRCASCATPSRTSTPSSAPRRWR